MVRPDLALGPRWQDRLPLGRAMAGGGLAGLVGGAAMLLFLMIQSALVGGGFWLPPQLIAAASAEGAVRDGGAVALGLAVHFSVAALFGVLFGATFGRLRSERTGVVLGLIYGVLVWALMTFTIVPWRAEPLAAFIAALPWGWLSAHLVFGAVVGLSPALARAFTRTTTTPFVTEPKELPL